MNTDETRKINDCLTELKSIKTWIDKNPLDSNTKYLVAYSIVRSSGSIEQVFKQLVFEFLAEKSKQETQYYLEKQIVDSSCNPNVGNMLRIMEQVDIQRRKRFDDLTKGTQERQDLGSLVTLRNDIAHGRTNNPSINNVIRYFEAGVAIVNQLDQILSSEKITTVLLP